MSWFRRKPKVIPPKPEDTVEYLFCFQCPNTHAYISNKRFVDQVIDRKRLCDDCGELGKAAIFKKTQEAHWTGTFWTHDKYIYDWSIVVNPNKPVYDFVRFLDKSDGAKSLDEVIDRLRELAAKEMHDDITLEQSDAYNVGLEDGTSVLADYILSELKESE